MKYLKTKILLVLTLILFLLCITSCNKTSTSNAIRIGVLEGPSAVSFIQMIDTEHTFEDKNVEIIIKSEPLQLQAMMMKNELDFAVIPTVMAANLYNKGVKYRMVACPIWGTLYLLSNDDNIRSFADLDGQDISVFGQGSTADILTQHGLKREKINWNSFDYRFSTNQEIAQALLMGHTKTAIISEPLVSVILDKDPNIRVVNRLACNGYLEDSQRDIFIQSAFVVSERFINTHPHLISEICDAYASSCNYVNENPENVAELMVRHNITNSIEVAKKSIELCNIQYVAAFALYKELYHYLQIFQSTKPESIGGKIPADTFVYQVHK